MIFYMIILMDKQDDNNDKSMIKKTNVPKIFASGSCRILQTLENLNNDKKIKDVEIIHTLKNEKNYLGKNFIGKMHNVKQHIQLIKFLRKEIIIPTAILPYVFSTCNKTKMLYKKRQNYEISKDILTNEINNIDVYVFEICSIKEYNQKGYYLMEPLLDGKINYNTNNLSYDNLVNDIEQLIKLVDKPVILQTHFRPNIFFDNETMQINNREIIYKACCHIKSLHNNVYVHDPSELIKLHGYDKMLVNEKKNNMTLYNHFTKFGHETNKKYIYKLIKSIISSYF